MAVQRPTKTSNAKTFFILFLLQIEVGLVGVQSTSTFIKPTFIDSYTLGGETYDPKDLGVSVWDGGAQYAIKLFVAQEFLVKNF